MNSSCYYCCNYSANPKIPQIAESLLPLLMERVEERRGELNKHSAYFDFPSPYPLGNCSCVALPPASKSSL